jgi:hypothetical protein
MDGKGVRGYRCNRTCEEVKTALILSIISFHSWARMPSDALVAEHF